MRTGVQILEHWSGGVLGLFLYPIIPLPHFFLIGLRSNRQNHLRALSWIKKYKGSSDMERLQILSVLDYVKNWESTIGNFAYLIPETGLILLRL